MFLLILCILNLVLNSSNLSSSGMGVHRYLRDLMQGETKVAKRRHEILVRFYDVSSIRDTIQMVDIDDIEGNHV